MNRKGACLEELLFAKMLRQHPNAATSFHVADDIKNLRDFQRIANLDFDGVTVIQGVHCQRRL